VVASDSERAPTFSSGSASAGGKTRGFAATPVTGALLVINVVAYAIQLFAVGRVEGLWKIPSSTMLAFGANDAFSVIYDVRPETLVTSAFLHVSAMHLVTNMVVLWLTGPRLETQVGSARFAVLYLLAALAAGVASLASAFVVNGEDHLSAGASGAVCGLLGASLVVGLRMGGWHTQMARASAPLLLFVALLGVRANALQIDNAAHVAGACTGMIAGASWQRGVATNERRQVRTLVGCAALCAAALVANVTRVAIDPSLALDAAGRYERAVNALSARRCADAWHDLRAAERLAPRSAQVAQLRDAIVRHCRR